MSVLRAGKTIEVALPVSREPDRLLRGYDGRYPSYFVCGPLVFSPVVSNAISYYFQYNPHAGRPQQPAHDPAIRPGAVPRRGAGRGHGTLAPHPDDQGLRRPLRPGRQRGQRDQGQEPRSPGRADPVVQGRIPHVPVRRGLRRDPGLPPQGDARSDRAAHERERDSPPGKSTMCWRSGTARSRKPIERVWNRSRNSSRRCPLLALARESPWWTSRQS